MIHITESAQAHFAKLLAHQSPGTQIRVFVINPGTHRAECGVSYCPPESISADDTELKFSQLSAYVDAKSKPYLQDAEIDLVTDNVSSQLTLKAPHAKKITVRDRDEDTLIYRVEYFLNNRINPQLSAHGGQVTLVDITDDMMVILQLHGGCNGCSMVDLTLKEGIEKALLKEFPTLKGVQDITKHHRGHHSYW